MNKNALVEAVSVKLDMPVKDARAAGNALTDTITRALCEGDKVTITGFGTFMPVARKEREARNPVNGEKIRVTAKTAVVFRAGSEIRGRVNGE